MKLTEALAINGNSSLAQSRVSKSWLILKDPDAGKDWRQEENGMTQGEMVGWHHWLSGHEFERAAGDGEGQGSLECCSPWGCKELGTTEQLNNNKQEFQMSIYDLEMQIRDQREDESNLLWKHDIQGSHRQDFHWLAPELVFPSDI